MKKELQIVIFLLIGALLVTACGASPEAVTQDDTSLPIEVEDSESTALDSPSIDPAAVYKSKCSRCHGEDRSGGSGPSLTPDRLSGDAAQYSKIISNGQGGMPSWSGKLSAAEIDALADWILTTPQ